MCCCPFATVRQQSTHTRLCDTVQVVAVRNADRAYYAEESGFAALDPAALVLMAPGESKTPGDSVLASAGHVTVPVLQLVGSRDCGENGPVFLADGYTSI